MLPSLSPLKRPHSPSYFTLNLSIFSHRCKFHLNKENSFWTLRQKKCGHNLKKVQQNCTLVALFINPYPTDNPNPMILILILADNESSKNFFPFPFFADSAIVEKASLTCHCTKNTIASSLFIIDLHCVPVESLR